MNASDQIAAAMDAIEVPFDGISDTQEELLDELSTLYREKGLLTSHGRAPALARCCEHASDCWGKNADREVAGRSRVDGADNGSIFWPWVGPGYMRGTGICLISLNIHHRGGDWYGLGEEYAIAHSYAGIYAKRSRKKKLFSEVPAFQLDAAAMVLDSRAGRPVTRQAGAYRLQGLLNDVARLQAVKCTPVNQRNGAPTPSMSRTCPGHVLHAELDILRPKTIITFGKAALNAVADWLDPQITWNPTNAGRPYQRTRAADGTEVFALYHPAYRNRRVVNEILDQMATDLTARPAA